MNERYGRDYDDDDDGRGDWDERSDRNQRNQRDLSLNERGRGSWERRVAQGPNLSSGDRYAQGRVQFDESARYGEGRYRRGDYSGEFGGSSSERRYYSGNASREPSPAWRGPERSYTRGSQTQNDRYDRSWDSAELGRSSEGTRREDDWTRRSDGSAFGSTQGRSYGYGNYSYGQPGLGGFFGKGPKGYVRSDERIREDVCDRLSIDDEIDASDITVTVKDGEVTLAGTVPDRRSKHRAEDLAESVSGVKDIHNSLKPQKGFFQEMGDRVTGRADAEQHGHSGAGPRNGTSANRL